MRILFLRLPQERTEEKIRLSKIKGSFGSTVALGEPIPGSRAITVDFQLADELYRMLVELTDRLSLDLNVGSLFAGLLPEMVNIKPMAANEQLVWGILQGPLEQALNELVSQRRQEGEVLFQDLVKRCSHVDDLVGKISARAPLVYEEYRLRLEKKLQGALGPHRSMRTGCLQNVL